MSGGYAIGNCLIKQKSIISHSRYNIPTSMVSKEILRLDKASQDLNLGYKKNYKKNYSSEK